MRHSFNFLCVCTIIQTFCLNNAFAADDFITQDMPTKRPIKSIALKNRGAIMPGAGYSHDSEQVPSNICFNTKINAVTSQQGSIKLSSAISFDELQKQLHANVSANFGIGRFSAKAEADYLRTIQDLDYSLSLNYYEILFNEVSLQLNGTGENILTPHGIDIYKNANRYFNILCGDDFISSFQQGAMLLMGINIRFTSHLDKKQFNASARASFGNIIDAATQIQNYSQQYHLRGSVIIEAFQKGGDPSQLSKILSNDPNGAFYMLTCDLQHMESCVKAANGLLMYAVQDFPKQISFKTGEEKNLVPLGTGFIKHDPIDEYGLQPPDSLVTQEVIADRKTLAKLLDENQYYQQKLNEFLYGYPVPYATDTHLYQQTLKLYKLVNQNIDAIMASTNPDDGALKCYNHPSLCHHTLNTIVSKLYTITEQDLAYLKPFANVVRLSFWPQTNDWFPIDDTGANFLAPAGEFNLFSGHMEIKDSGMENVSLHIVIGPRRPLWIFLNGKLDKELNDNFYKGTLCFLYHGTKCNYYRAEVLANPFFISKYN